MSVTSLVLTALLPLTVGGSAVRGEGPSPTPPRGSPEGQAAPAPTPGRWVFTSLPQADLWFHGMAIVDPQGPGPNPLYDPSYPARIRRAKEEAGLPSTPLDRQAGHFRDAFRRDPAMDVLHFLPLYFADAGRTEMFSALRALSTTGRGIPASPSPRTRLGLLAVGSVLTTPGQRFLLGEFVAALNAEWDGFLAGYRETGAAGGDESGAAAQELWDRRFGPPLSPFLRGLDLSAGTVVLTPSIGAEGRVFSGVPGDPADNVLVVSAPRSGEDPKTVVFSMLRELSFTLAREALGSGEIGPDPGKAEALAARGAIRAGALALERLLPEELQAYQEFFLSRAGLGLARRGDPTSAFQEVYPLDDGQLKALRESVNMTITNGGEV